MIKVWGRSNIQYPPKILKLKYREISFVQNISFVSDTGRKI